jgi:hypothetical protein
MAELRSMATQRATRSLPKEPDVTNVPDSTRFDESVRLLIEGYGFISKRCSPADAPAGSLLDTSIRVRRTSFHRD